MGSAPRKVDSPATVHARAPSGIRNLWPFAIGLCNHTQEKVDSPTHYWRQAEGEVMRLQYRYVLRFRLAT